MKIDIARQIGAVTRSVTARQHEGRQARVIVVEQTYPTSAGDLWEAVTTAERLPRWFMPITGDLRIGGRFQLEGNAGGEILVCKRPRLLKVTWEFGGKISWVDVHIKKVTTESARLTLEHLLFEDEHWDLYGPGGPGVGWDMGLMGLLWHLETGQSTTPADGMAWLMSEDGKTFSRRSSDAWRVAAIASGTDPEAANAAAERTTSAYTGA